MPALTFSAWLAPDDPAGLASFESHAGLLSRIYPLWYCFGPDGIPGRRAEAGQEERLGLLALARAHGVELWPHIPIRASSDAPSHAQALALLRLVQEDGAQGVDLDYGPLEHAGRDVSKALVTHVCEVFHAAGLKVGVVLRAGLEEDGISARASACDRLQFLGPYPGLGGRGAVGMPGPLAPPDWCGEVLARATSLAPAGKLEWGLPACGRDWGPDGSAMDLPWDAWGGMVKAHPPERRDPGTAELSLRHDGREAWTNDAISLTAKLWQVRLHGVAEAALWGLGAEDPRLWALLDSLPKDFLGTEEA
jgi:hypothetical protein